MTFSAKQLRALRRNVRHEHIRTREIRGRDLSYIEGWHAIDEANRIFGFDAWDRETLETKCVQAREVRGQFTAVYLAKVRVTVRAGGQVVLREGQGTGEAQGATIGEVHDKAIKSAETDATKRALATFGRPFGLGLYLGVSSGRSAATSGSRAVPVNRTVAAASANSETGQAKSALVKLQAQTTTAPVDKAIQRPCANLTEPRSSANESAGPRQTAQSERDSPKSVAVQTDGYLLASNDNDGPPRIDKSLLSLSVPKRLRDKKHLLYVAGQPCLVCGRTPSDAHHLRFAQPRALGRKVSDEFTVPLCRGHHRQLHHSGNEIDWWQVVEIDPLPIAEQLWRDSRTSKNGLIPEGAQTAGASPAIAPSEEHHGGGHELHSGSILQLTGACLDGGEN